MALTFLVALKDESHAEVIASYVAEAHRGVDVRLFHVVEYTEKKTSLSRGGRDKPDGWYAKALDNAEDLFETVRETLEPSVGEITTAVESGDASAEILEQAAEIDADGIVLGFRKRSPTGKLIFGSTAQDVLLSASCPVVAVPPTDA